MKEWLGSLGRHKGFKLLSLLLAVALWAAVGGEERTETTLTLPLELANLPPKMMVTSEVPPSLQVRVVGPGTIVRKLAQTRPAYTVDLIGAKPGRRAYPLGPKSFNFPRGVVVSRVQPNPLYITLTPAITRLLQVQPLLEGKPPEGFEVLEVKVKPSQVQVEGPYNEISDLKFLPTLPIDVSQLTESATVATDLDLKNLHLTVKEQGPILAHLAVEPRQATRTFTVPLASRPQKVRLATPQVTVTVKGSWLVVKDLKPQEVKAAVDSRNLAPGRHRLRVSVELPQGVGLVRVQPEAVTAQITK